MSGSEIPYDLFHRTLAFFEDDTVRTANWWMTENPLLGGVSPQAMIDLGRESKLRRWINQQLADEGIMDRSEEPCADCGLPSGRTFATRGMRLLCSQCFAKGRNASKAAAVKAKMDKAEKDGTLLARDGAKKDERPQRRTRKKAVRPSLPK